MVCEGEADWHPISGPVLSIQAQKLYIDLLVDNPSDFIVSKGWLHRFQRHHGINQVKINRYSCRRRGFSNLRKYSYKANTGLVPD